MPCAQGLLSESQVSCPFLRRVLDTLRGLPPQCWASLAATRVVTKGPTVTRHRGREGQGALPPIVTRALFLEQKRLYVCWSNVEMIWSTGGVFVCPPSQEGGFRKEEMN